MTDYSALLQPDMGQPAHELILVNAAGFEGWLKDQPDAIRAAVAAQGFSAKANELAILPGEKPDEWSAVLGVANPTHLRTWCLAKAAEALPAGSYRVGGHHLRSAPLGWMLAQYRFDTYKKPAERKDARILLTDRPGHMPGHIAEAEATDLVRTLVNIPAADLGPAELQQWAKAAAEEFGATLTVTRGEDLESGFPMVASVGRAAPPERGPRMIELEWGDPAHPRIAIVGKGVTFDSGGLDIKSAAGMQIMKKDMGGAAHALALSRLVMGAELPVRLHMLIPAVENSISGDAIRPGDILSSRKGLFVEIGNTDAEGRLILGDALARACEEKPELILDFATLTGAARTALGPDLPGLFSDDDELAAALFDAGMEQDDPVWRLPLWSDYEEMLSSDVADIGNSAASGYAGATTAALFLRKFVDQGPKWAHFDTFAWRPGAKPGRPKGGEALGLRASWAVLKARYAAG